MCFESVSSERIFLDFAASLNLSFNVCRSKTQTFEYVLTYSEALTFFQVLLHFELTKTQFSR